jgi:hypothetical protein
MLTFYVLRISDVKAVASSCHAVRTFRFEGRFLSICQTNRTVRYRALRSWMEFRSTPPRVVTAVIHASSNRIDSCLTNYQHCATTFFSRAIVTVVFQPYIAPCPLILAAAIRLVPTASTSTCFVTLSQRLGPQSWVPNCALINIYFFTVNVHISDHNHFLLSRDDPQYFPLVHCFLDVSTFVVWVVVRGTWSWWYGWSEWIACIGKTTILYTLVRKSPDLYIYGHAGIYLRTTLKLIKGKYAVRVYEITLGLVQ